MHFFQDSISDTIHKVIVSQGWNRPEFYKSKFVRI